MLQICDEFIGYQFSKQLDTRAVDVVGQRPIRLGAAVAGGRVARADRCCVRTVRAVRDGRGRGPVLRGHRSAAVPRDGERGQLRGGRGPHVVPVRGGRRPVRRSRTERGAGRVSVRVPRGVRRAAVCGAVCHRVLRVREDMHCRAPEQRAGPPQRVRTRSLATATAAAATAAAAAAIATTVAPERCHQQQQQQRV